MTTRLVYVADAMCSWCWGFAPELEVLRDRFGLPVEVVVGGLRPGPAAQPLDTRLRRYLAATWERIHELTGQPFDPSPLAWDPWIYDTELPARAVVTMRSLSPADTLPFFVRLQRAFYAEAVDITDPTEYGTLLEPFDLEAAPFLERLASEDSRRQAWQDFDRVRTMGVSGFPALFVQAGPRRTTVTLGYRPAPAIAPAVERALEGRAETPNP